MERMILFYTEVIMNKLFLYEDFFTKDEKEVVSFGKLSATRLGSARRILYCA